MTKGFCCIDVFGKSARDLECRHMLFSMSSHAKTGVQVEQGSRWEAKRIRDEPSLPLEEMLCCTDAGHSLAAR